MEDCLFCKIIEGEIPSEKIYEDECVYAFEDIKPTMPVHILVVPKKHIQSLAQMEAGDEILIAKIFEVINKLAEEKGIKKTGYRVLTNSGKDALQIVPHLHFHLLGGRLMTTGIGKC